MFNSYEDFKCTFLKECSVEELHKKAPSIWSTYLKSKQGGNLTITLKCKEGKNNYKVTVDGKERKFNIERNIKSFIANEESDLPEDLLIARKYINKYNNAKKRGLEFDLSLSDVKRLLKRKTCYYTGVILLEEAEDGNPFGRTIDRVDPNKGYIKGNVVSCCYAANNLKATLERDSEGGLTLTQKIKFCKKFLEGVN